MKIYLSVLIYIFFVKIFSDAGKELVQNWLERYREWEEAFREYQVTYQRWKNDECSP